MLAQMHFIRDPNHEQMQSSCGTAFTVKPKPTWIESGFCVSGASYIMHYGTSLANVTTPLCNNPLTWKYMTTAKTKTVEMRFKRLGRFCL